MPKSKVNDRYGFDRNHWVVSLLNTGKGTRGVVGGHGKIVVEGVKQIIDPQIGHRDELFVGEYHIMAEMDDDEVSSLLPQFLQNSKGKLIVLYSERDHYQLHKIKTYQGATSTSWTVPKADVLRMIEAIKVEKEQCELGNNPSYQYAGNYCIYSYGGGHNCITWCEEKLQIMGVGNGMILTDTTKALPEVHAKCTLL